MFKTKKLLSFLISSFAVLTVSAAEKPNVLFICVDDLKPNLGSYGDLIAQTPNFDRIAREGTIFTNAHCNQAVCGPSRASTFTSLRPDRTRVHDLQTAWLEANPKITTLPQHLRENGFSTAGTGKVFHAGKSETELNKRSWDRFVEMDDLPFNEEFGQPAGKFYQGEKSRAIYEQAIASGEKRTSKIMEAMNAANARPAFEMLNIPDDAYNDGAIRKQALKFLGRFSQDETKPFFISVGFKKPHLPFVAPKKYWDLYDPATLPLATVRKSPDGAPQYAGHSFGELRNYSGIPKKGPIDSDTERNLVHGYYACVSFVDAQLGKLLDALEEKGLKENTLVVIWSDHGWHLGDHGIWCKHSNFEQATRSVLMFSGPGVVAGEKNASPVELIDVFPTVCDLVDAPVIPELDGVSLMPILKGEAESVRKVAVSQYGRDHRKVMGYSLRGERFRYTAWVKNGEFQKAIRKLETDMIVAEELYDYETDPLEERSLAADSDQKNRVVEFRRLLKNHIAQQGVLIGNDQ